MFKNLEHFVRTLEQENELLRIKTFVDPILEIAEITDRISKMPHGGKAILFENTGTDFPVLTNALGSDKRMALALGYKSIDILASDIEKFITNLTSPKKNFQQKIKALKELKTITNIFPTYTKKAECQDVVYLNPDLNILPILQCWPKDGGKFITLPVVHTIDPNTKIRNVGMYRMQIFGKNLTGMHWHKHKVGARHYNEYKKINTKIPVAVTLGGDPVYTYCATAPLPDHFDEYLLAGFIRKKSVKLVKCITQNIEVPADVDFVIEGYIDPQEELIYEGPFGDHTGYYSTPDYYPKFHVTCITHKKNAIYPATLVGIPPQEDAYIAKTTEKIFEPLIKKSIAPEVLKLHLPEAGVAHNFAIVKIKKEYEGQELKVANSLWGNGQMALNKYLFITDNEEIDIENYKEFAQTVLQNFNPKTDLFFSKGPLDVLDHSAEKFTLGSKVAFLFSKKNNKKNKFINTKIPDIKELQNHFPEITNFLSLIKINIPIAIITLNKKQKVSSLAENLHKIIDLKIFKILIFVDNIIDINNLYLVAWLTGANTAPARDLKIINNTLIVDATNKTQNIDQIDNWPKIAVSDIKTIETVNKKWEQYQIGNFIKSPSLQIKS